MNIIGIGTPGVKIADQFSLHPQYRIYKIDSAPGSAKNYHKIPKLTKPEDYETQDIKDLSFLSKLSGNTIVVLSGSSYESSISLRIMEKIHKKCNITVLYIQPDPTACSPVKLVHEKVIRNVLQQYARSGVFDRMIMVSNRDLEAATGPPTIKKYFNSLHERLVSGLHSINVLENTASIYSTFNPVGNTSRIITIGVFDVETGEEKSFFPLDLLSEKRYYYLINKKIIDTDVDILTKIRKDMESLGPLSSYAVYEYDYD